MENDRLREREILEIKFLERHQSNVIKVMLTAEVTFMPLVTGQTLPKIGFKDVILGRRHSTFLSKIVFVFFAPDHKINIS
jgi:hypothetical protein